MMSLEEAIKHCEEKAEELERRAEEVAMNDEEGVYQPQVGRCRECADEHRQLAKWLRELVHLRNITEYLRDFIDCFGSMDSMHYNEDIIEWAESKLRVDMREVNADE